MKRRNASGRSLARSVGVTEGAVRKWLRGKKPRETFLVLCALQLDVDPQWLAEGIGRPEAPGVTKQEKRSLATALLLWQRKQIAKATDDLRKQIEEYLSLIRRQREQGIDTMPAFERPLVDLQESLDDVTHMRYESPMPPEMAKKTMSELMRQVERLTKARGSRAKLARFLNVRPQRLNEWLNHGRVPRGGISLLLRDWARAEGARQQQEKGSESAETPSKPKARKKRRSDQ